MYRFIMHIPSTTTNDNQWPASERRDCCLYEDNGNGITTVGKKDEVQS
jgi:hypothetical protein